MLFATVFCIAITFVTKSQPPALNKQKTLEYINDLYSKATKFQSLGIAYTLDNKILVKSYLSSSYAPERFDLLKVSLMLNYLEQDKSYTLFDKNKGMLVGILIESEANRLKKALEHLIELVKNEKNTDPFDN